METRDLEYILAVGREGGIGRAALALGISQPALTKAIQRVEAQLEMPLFERTSRGMLASAAGRAFIERAKRIQLAYDDAIEEVRAIRVGAMGSLRLGYSPSVANTVARACRQLLHDRPGTRLRLREQLAQTLLDGLQAGEFDLVVAPIPRQPVEGLKIRELFSDRVHIVADKNHPLLGHPTLTLHDLKDQEWMLPPRTIPVRQQIDEAFCTQGLAPPTVRVETDFGTPSVFKLVLGSQMLTGVGIDRLSAGSGLLPLDIRRDQLDLGRRIGALHRDSAYLSPLAMRMLEVLDGMTRT